jgi:hypothetical protein
LPNEVCGGLTIASLPFSDLELNRQSQRIHDEVNFQR